VSKAQILSTDTPERLSRAVQIAADFLRDGKVVAVPTETVYGLAANAFDPAAVDQIFRLKGRPSHNPIIVHVASIQMAQACVQSWPAVAQKLADAFWPGPLTLVLPSSERIPQIVTAGGATVGIRWPQHPFMQRLIAQCGFPLAAPSANLSNQLSPTSADHVREQIGDQVPLIVDGGPCVVGIESSVLDLTVQPPRILRPGMVGRNALLSVTGALASAFRENELILKSTSQLKKHYAPRAKLKIWNWSNEREFSHKLKAAKIETGRICALAHSKIPSGAGLLRVSVIPHDPEAFARAIYAELHTCDQLGAELIIVEALPDGPEWEAIADRLKRAAHT